MKLPVLQTAQALLPTQLSDMTQRAVNELLGEGESRNTQMSYRSALRYWAAWYAIRYGSPIALPAPVACVLQFIVDHAERTTGQGLVCELPAEMDAALVKARYKGKLGALAHNTLQHRISVLSKVHQLRELKNPCHDPKVRELLSRTRKAYAKRGVVIQKKHALTQTPLQAILDTCDDTLKGKRDRALLLFAWASGGRRRSEVTQAQMDFLHKLESGGYTYTLAYSKTNQSGVAQPNSSKPVMGVAGQALDDWLQASGVASGAIFRRIRKGGQVAGALSPAAVRDIVKARCALAGMEGDFSAHSLRSGFVTEAGRQHIPLAETMAMTGHQSVATVLGYFRAEALVDRPVAHLLAAAKRPTPKAADTGE